MTSPLVPRATVALALLGFVLPAVAPAALHAQRSADRAGAGRDTARWVDNCRDNGDDDRVRHCEVRDTRLRATGAFDLDSGPNGGVSIIGWEGDSVLLRAFVQAQANGETEAREIASQVRVSSDGGRVRASGPSSRRGRSWSVSYELFVPRRADVTASSENGPVSARGVSGRLDLSTHNGPVTLRDVGGDVHGRTRNGPVTVELSGSRWNGRGLDAETGNGPVTLTIPEGYSARLETGTVNGPMRVDFPITVQGRINRQIEATLGDGGPTVRVVTTNGPVTVRKS
ncbi:MAG: DUF4097 family beta strand repeat-containing protein [Gemmatimonadaceae bacterium]